MSASACIVYFGLRFTITSDEIDGLEGRTDPRVVSARKAGLKYYWANFSDGAPKYLLFVGTEVGIVGPEKSFEAVRTAQQMQALFSATQAKLIDAGLEGEPYLHVQWQPDL